MNEMPDTTGEKQGKFKKGKSGNPRGRPKGIRNKASILAEKLFENDVEAICWQAIEQAKKGNIQAIKIILDRILPTRKESSIIIDLPIVNTAQDILQSINQVSAAICHGEISPAEGEILTRIIDRQAKAVELSEFDQRLKKLEERQNNENFQ